MNREIVGLIVVGTLLVVSVTSAFLWYKQWKLAGEDEESSSLPGTMFLVFTLISIFLSFGLASYFNQWLQTIPSGVIK